MNAGAQVRTIFLRFESLDLAPSWGWRDLGFSGHCDVQAASAPCLLLTSYLEWNHQAVTLILTLWELPPGLPQRTHSFLSSSMVHPYPSSTLAPHYFMFYFLSFKNVLFTLSSLPS